MMLYGEVDRMNEMRTPGWAVTCDSQLSIAVMLLGTSALIPLIGHTPRVMAPYSMVFQSSV